RKNSALTNWLPARTAAYLAQLRSAGFFPRIDAPIPKLVEGASPGNFEIQFPVAAVGTLCYTLDGTDPRLAGGAPSASALIHGATTQTELPVPFGSRWRWYSD